MRYVAGANQVLNMVKVAGTLRRRNLDGTDLDDFHYRRVRRFIKALKLEAELELE